MTAVAWVAERKSGRQRGLQVAPAALRRGGQGTPVDGAATDVIVRCSSFLQPSYASIRSIGRYTADGFRNTQIRSLQSGSGNYQQRHRK